MRKRVVAVALVGLCGCKALDLIDGDDVHDPIDAGPDVCEPPMPTGGCTIQFGFPRVDPGVPAIAVAMADLDGDQRLDIVTTSDDREVRIAYATGGGAFGPSDAYPTGNAPVGLAIDDVDGDGDRDIAVINSGDNTLTVFFNQGGHIFNRPGTPYATGANPYAIAIADFDNDGTRAIAVAHYDVGEVRLYRHLALATSPNVATYASPTNVRFLAASDINGDGRADLLSLTQPAASSDSSVHVQLGTTTGFANEVAYPTGSFPQSIAIADLDGDDARDVIVGTGGEAELSILRNTGNGTLAARTTVATGRLPHSVAATDLDGDGDIDLVAATREGATVVPNAGGGVFGQYVTYGTGGDSTSGGFEPYFLTAGDVTGDAKPELVTTSEAGVSILRNNGFGSFALYFSIATAIDINSVVSAHIDGDAQSDIVAVDWMRAQIQLFLGRGGGTFERRAIPSGAAPSDVAVGDFDGDDIADLAVTHGLDRTVGIFIGNGDGSFDGMRTYPTGSSPFGVATLDVNQDGHTDLVVGNDVSFPGASDPEGDSISLLVNNGDGTFAPQVRYPVAGPRGIATGDIDGDGITDLVVAGAHGGSARVFLARDGALVEAPSVAVSGQPSGVALADFDGDCRLDLAIASIDGAVTIQRGDGAGGFEQTFTGVPQTARMSTDMGEFTARDLDGDGRPDLLLSNVAGMSVIFVGANRSVRHQSFPTQGYAWLVDDISGDGRPDLVTNAPTSLLPPGELYIVAGECAPSP